MAAPDDVTPVYVISVAAQLAGMHPQTLRAYDRLGLVSPGRSSGRGRRYSARDVSRLRQVQRLSQEEGLNLEGVRRVLELQDQVLALQQRVRELAAELADSRRAAENAAVARRAELVPVDRGSGALLVWQRPRPSR